MFLEFRSRRANRRIEILDIVGFDQIVVILRLSPRLLVPIFFNLRFCDEKIIRLEIRYVEQYSFSCSFRKSYF